MRWKKLFPPSEQITKKKTPMPRHRRHLSLKFHLMPGFEGSRRGLPRLIVIRQQHFDYPVQEGNPNVRGCITLECLENWRLELFFEASF